MVPKIKELRIENNLTQPQLAKIIGVGNSIISFWENNINEPKARYIAALAKCFNVDADYLLDTENIKLNKTIINKKNQIMDIYKKLNKKHQNLLTKIGKELLISEIKKNYSE